MVTPDRPATKISLVLADVDGTLVHCGESLTSRAGAAVKALQTRNCLCHYRQSSAARHGDADQSVGLRTAVAGFNGGISSSPTYDHPGRAGAAADAAKGAVDVIFQEKDGCAVRQQQGSWLVRDPNAPHVARVFTDRAAAPAGAD